MSDDAGFAELIRRVRGGDQAAATELVRRYEPFIRRTVRARLVDARLATLFDSMDICQSVLGSFFVRVAAGQYELETPDQLIRLLVSMARNKLASQARRHHAERRDQRRVAATGDAIADLPGDEPTPSHKVATVELVQELFRRLTPEERELLELRNRGCDWATIAAQRGGSPAALRKRLSRALDRVARELGLDGTP